MEMWNKQKNGTNKNIASHERCVCGISSWAHVRCSPMHILFCGVHQCSHLSSDESASECIWTWLVVCPLSVHKTLTVAQWLHASVCVCVCGNMLVHVRLWPGRDVPPGWDLARGIKAMLHVVTELWSTTSKRRITRAFSSQPLVIYTDSTRLLFLLLLPSRSAEHFTCYEKPRSLSFAPVSSPFTLRFAHLCRLYRPSSPLIVKAKGAHDNAEIPFGFYESTKRFHLGKFTLERKPFCSLPIDWEKLTIPFLCVPLWWDHVCYQVAHLK